MFKTKCSRGGEGDGDMEAGMVRSLLINKDTKTRGTIASSVFPPVVKYNVTFRGRSNEIIEDACTLDFWPPLNQLQSMITQLNKLKDKHECDYIVVINNKCLDVVELRNLLVLYDIKNTKYQVEEENEWFCKISNAMNQPNGTPVVESTLPSIFNSMLHDTNEDHFWTHLQLKTCEIKRLASNRWLSDLIVYRIIELINESSPDTFAFYYNFVSDIRHIVQRIRVKHANVNPKKIIFAINVGKWNGKTYPGNTMIGSKVISGCHFAMGVYYAELNQLVYGDSQGWPMPLSVIQELKQVISSIFGMEKSQKMTCTMCHVPNKKDIVHSCSTECWRYYPLQTCSHICGISAIISMCLASSPDDSFLSLKGAPGQAFHGYESLKNISRYNDFLRLVVLQWLLNKKIDISVLRCAEVAHESENLQQGRASVPIEAANLAVEGSDCDNFPNETEKEELSHDNTGNSTPSHYTAHNISNIRLGSTDTNFCRFIETCTEFGGRKCTVNYTHYHCTLCPPCKHFPSLHRITRHIQQTHVNPAKTFEYDGYLILPCKQEHFSHLYRGCRSHYHCPVCNKTVLRKSFFLNHMRNHTLRMKAVKSLSKASTNSQPNRNEYLSEIEATYETMINHVVKEPEPEAENSHYIEEVTDFNQGYDNIHLTSQHTIKRTPNPPSLCNLCGKSMLRKNLKRHWASAHNYVDTKAVCCDQERGLYMVRKNEKGGIGYPVHVQKIIHDSTSTSIDCGDLNCKLELQLASRAKMKGHECRHLLQVNNASYPEQITLLESRILELGQENHFKVLKNETITKCIQLNEQALQINAPAVVQWQDGNYIHMSVLDNNLNRPVQMRCIVSFNRQNGQFNCQCTRKRYFCIHRAIGLWFLYQTNQLHSSILDEAYDGMEEGNLSSDDECNVPEPQKMQTFGDFLYPPQDSITLGKMCNYLKTQKQIPVDIPHEFIGRSVDSIPNTYIPIENQCHECNQKLKGPFLISKNAKVLTMSGLLQGHKTFVKICPICRVYYRYQEFTDGVHNFDDKFLITLDTCLFIRESVKHHVAVGTICEIFEQHLHIKLKQHTVLNAYLHFVALTAHNYDFNCVICGFHPPVLIADLNRKVVFKCHTIDENIPNNDDNTADYVDCIEFWNKVENNMISRGFSPKIPVEFEVKPAICNWSPHIGRFTRSSNLLVNTEHRKIHKATGEIEEDCRELSEERLIEFMHKEKLPEIRELARKAGISDKGSKLDIINRMKGALERHNVKFNKVFKKLWGCSGGWLTMTCTHGIIYGVKFLLRSESPRDYIDMLRSMKHRPNVVICDMAHMVAVQGNRFQEDFFCPFEGRVAESTVENIEKAKSGDLNVSFPFLLDNKGIEEQSTDLNCHPVTGSNVRLSLFDVFHQSNTKNDKEVLRRIGCVKELKGIVNSQAAEQLHRSFNKDKHFLNQMTPVNHIFMFRSVIELHNKEKNIKICEKLRARTNAGISMDELGRSCLLTFDREAKHYGNPLYVHQDIESLHLDSNMSPTLFSDCEANSEYNGKFHTDSNSFTCDIPPKKQRKATVSSCDNNNDCVIVNASDTDQVSIDSNVSIRKSPIEKQPEASFSASCKNDDCIIVNTCDIDQVSVDSNVSIRKSPIKKQPEAPVSPSDKDDDCIIVNACGIDQVSIDSNVSIRKRHIEKQSEAPVSASCKNDDCIIVNTCDIDQVSVDSNVSIRKRHIEKQLQASFSQCAVNNYCDTVNACDNDKSYIESDLLSRSSPTTEQQKDTLSQCDNDCDIANTSLWIKDLGLTYADKQLIEDGSAINAAIVNASSKLIRQENKALGGLLPIGPTGSYKGNGESFLQILRVNNDHWVTMSNVLTEYGNVSIYDSAMRLHYRHNSKEIRYNVSIELDACNLRALPEKTMTIFVEDTLQVKKDSDSGIAAIVFALAIARNLNPTTINFKYKQLRKRLIECFENLTFKSITYDASPRRQLKRKFEFTVPLFCHCNKPDFGDCMIECSTCGNWYHMGCETVKADIKDWKCKTCSDSGTLDIQQHIEEEDRIETANELIDHSKIGNMSWKQLMDYSGEVYETSCQAVDLPSFEAYVKSSSRKAWVCALLDSTDIELPHISSDAELRYAMKNPNIQLICKYNTNTYEKAFKIIEKLIIHRNRCKFPIGRRGIDKAMVLRAKILQRYFEDLEV